MFENIKHLSGGKYIKTHQHQSRYLIRLCKVMMLIVSGEILAETQWLYFQVYFFDSLFCFIMAPNTVVYHFFKSN
uniref:Uncharacterized protein n=1 Tax=Anguilla anguilla TaxID=7936 RepID=A0A0E9XP98_ANGAN